MLYNALCLENGLLAIYSEDAGMGQSHVGEVHLEGLQVYALVLCDDDGSLDLQFLLLGHLLLERDLEYLVSPLDR